MLTLYGLKTCDTCRKARAWLDERGLDYRYHDVRGDGLDEQLLRAWARETDWQTLLNRRSKTWREVPEDERSGIDEQRAIDMMLKQPTLLKRPVLDGSGFVEVGFSPARYAELVG